MDFINEQHIAFLEIGEQTARSAAFSMVGPLVARRLPPIALAMILARVVLPSPGGPESSR